MKKTLKILVVAPEVAPFSKTTLFAEFNGSYPKKLKNIGHDVRIITPQYRSVNERKYTLRDVIRLKDIDVVLGNESVKINVKSSFLPDSKVQVYFIDYKPYFFREGLYRDPGKNESYSDNDKRFILFSKSVMETLKKLQWQPDVIHCNEWQTGLIPFFLHYIYKKDTFFQSVSTLYTIRDFSSQGNFNEQCMSHFGLEEQTSDIKNKFINNGEFSFLKAGIKTADCVNSTTSLYLKKLESDDHYKELFKLRKDKLSHIQDQIDCTVWDSEHDPYIPVPFSAEIIEDKEKNKKAILERYKLQFDDDTPVCAIISSFIDSEGIELIKESFKNLLKMNVYLLIITSKENRHYNFFKEMKKKYKNRIGLQEHYDVKLEHMTLAGSDIMLLPTLFDSTGLSAEYCFMYGVLPIIYKAAVTTEYISKYDDKNKNGNALIIDGFNSKSLISKIKKAVDLFNNKKIWDNVLKNIMNRDFLKQETIKKYEKLYNKCVKKQP